MILGRLKAFGPEAIEQERIACANELKRLDFVLGNVPQNGNISAEIDNVLIRYRERLGILGVSPNKISRSIGNKVLAAVVSFSEQNLRGKSGGRHIKQLVGLSEERLRTEGGDSFSFSAIMRLPLDFISSTTQMEFENPFESFRRVGYVGSELERIVLASSRDDRLRYRDNMMALIDGYNSEDLISKFSKFVVDCDYPYQTRFWIPQVVAPITRDSFDEGDLAKVHADFQFMNGIRSDSFTFIE